MNAWQGTPPPGSGGFSTREIQATPSRDSLKKTLQLCYILYGVSYFLGCVPAIVAIVIAYVKRGDAAAYPELSQHFRWQINTFWGVLILGLAGLVTSLIGIGFVLLIAGAVWSIYRAVKGWIFLNEGRPLYR